MFPLRRTPKEPEIDWPALLGLLEDDDRRAAIARLAPIPGRESYLMALRRMHSPIVTETLAAGRRLDTSSRLVDRPTIAVAGMLNSGKTSLVSSFLSPRGQQRTLRGTSNREGTHRFVLWLPESWRSDVELWSLLVSRIGDSLGQPPENLSDDPHVAAAQYNNRSGDGSQLAVALLATDPGLDEVGVGLLDCPDIVSDEELGLGSPARRKELLGRAATLCSAFLIVTDAASSRDTTLADLTRIASDLMPGVPRMLAVNKVRPRQSPDQIYETFSPLCKNNGVSTIYAAYDYDVPASSPFIPQLDDSSQEGRGLSSRDTVGRTLADASLSDTEPLPVFFEVAPSPDNNPPASIQEDRFLLSLPQKLDRGVLFSQLHRALRINLEKIVWDRGLEAISENAETSFVKTQQCQCVLLDASLEFFANRKMGGEVVELRMHQSERILRQLSESFAATAPWYARWGVRLNATIRNFVGGASDLLRSLTPSALSQRAADDIKGRFRSGEYGGLIAPENLLSEIARQGGTVVLSHYRGQCHDDEVGRQDARRQDAGGTRGDVAEQSSAASPAPVARSGRFGGDDDALLLAPIERAVIRFEQDDFTTLDPRRLDEAIRQMWTEIPMHKKLAHGLTPLATILAAFGAALMVPIDFGHSFILAASIPELLAAAGLGALAAMWAGNQGAREVGQQAARQQLADFHAVLCDELGIARPDPPMKVRVAGGEVTLPPSRISRSETNGPSMPVYRVRDEFVIELRKLLPRSAKAKK